MTGVDNMHSDVYDTKSLECENYKNIKPQKEMSVKELNSAVKEEYDKAAIEAKDNPRYIPTRNESLENDRHPITGVPFEKKIVELPNGDKIEGVFPKFESLFDAKISENIYLESDKLQFKECNKQLLSEINNNPELRSKFSEEQIEQIEDGVLEGDAPDGYVWNHDAEAGKIQLVDFEIHSRTGHTGGRAIWGGGSDYR